MVYTHPDTVLRPTRQRIREELAKLKQLEEAIEAEKIARENHLFQLAQQRKRRQRIGTYTLSPEQIAYKEKYGPIIAAQPAPKYGGQRGLELATLEAEGYWKRKQPTA